MKAWLTGALVAALAAAAGCSSPGAGLPGPVTTRIGSHDVALPAQLRANALIVEVKGGRDGPYHFLVDTGSSRTLLTPDAAKALGARSGLEAPTQVEVRSAEGRSELLPAATLPRLNLGAARFDSVPILIYDCAPLSDELGLRIDGVLGFSLFRNTRLTLDYPQSRVVLAAAHGAGRADGAAVLPMNPGNNIPVVTVQIGDRPIYAIVDSGKEVPFSLNRTVARQSDFGFGPIEGPAVHDLGGDHPQRVGRLAVSLHLGRYIVPRPLAELTEDLSTLGGGVLKFFIVTFDQQRGEVRLERTAGEAIAIPGERGAGVGFSRTPAYWRVAGVMSGSPAEKAGVSPGDLVTKIDGQPVAQWDLPRFDALLANTDHMDLTFLSGTREFTKTIPIVDLVP